MPLKVKSGGGGDYEMLPAGQYVARCYKIIDLGTQEITWQGDTKFQPKIQVTWEIIGEDDPKMADGRPFSISKTYTASLNEKSTLYKDLVSWRNKPFTQEELLGFDISKLIGAYCQLQVVHNPSGERVYANVNTIMSTKERPAAVNKDVMFDIAEPDMAVFESLPEWLKDKIRASEEWKAREVMARGKSEDKIIDPKDIDIDSKFAELEKEIESEDIDISDIPF